jgi:predicted TIM-barrel fold metal-dependent hydrolase
VLRRDLVKSLALLALDPLIGCESAAPSSRQPATSSLIDVHAHVFNASDLPAEKFIRVVILDLYPQPGVQQLLDNKDRDIVDWLIELFLFILGEDGAPSARKEIEVLSGRAAAVRRAQDLDTAGQTTIERTGEFLKRISLPRGPGIRQRGSTERGANLLRDALTRAANLENRSARSLTAADYQAVASAAYRSSADVGVYLRWFTLFTVYRHVLVDKLTADHQRQGYKPLVLAPATIDFSRWLGEDVTSPLGDQVMVMDLIARRPVAPAIHSYIAFDPLREVYYRHAKDRISPLRVAQDALVDHGFVGVKLYPPMGFKPIANSNTWSDYFRFIERNLGAATHLGEELDAALEDLYRLCVELQAPILAHAADSNGAGPGFADRADPAFWLPVFVKYPELRVCLAHFGRFTYRSKAAPANAPPPSPAAPEGSWEWTFGGYVQRHPTAPVFADLSFFSEILTGDAQGRLRLADAFQRFARTFDPNLDHLMFGTDWIMTGVVPGDVNYTHAVTQFFKEDCGFDDNAMVRLLVGNAVRFLGLREGDIARERLRRFYQRNGLADKLA